MDDESPYARDDAAPRLNAFFAERLPGQLGYVLDTVTAQGVDGHFEVTAPLIGARGSRRG